MALAMASIFVLPVLTDTSSASAVKVKASPLSRLSPEDQLAKMRIRWSRVDGSERISIYVHAGYAERENPHWTPTPSRLPYDLAQNRALLRTLRNSALGAPVSVDSTRATDRMLEIQMEGDKGWVTMTRFTGSLKQWRTRAPAVVEQLEPLFAVQADTFQPTQKHVATTTGSRPRIEVSDRDDVRSTSEDEEYPLEIR
jgi:hypothetical protein